VKRDLCGLAPVFSDTIKEGHYVLLTYRSKRGNVRFKGVCEVERNDGEVLLVKVYNPLVDETEEHLPSFWLKAKDVYHGKHLLEYWGKILDGRTWDV
jgi:hypothetical protein